MPRFILLLLLLILHSYWFRTISIRSAILIGLLEVIDGILRENLWFTVKIGKVLRYQRRRLNRYLNI